MSELTGGLVVALCLAATLLVLVTRPRSGAGATTELARARRRRQGEDAAERSGSGRTIRWLAGPRPRARAPSSEDVAASMVLLAVALQSGCGVVEAVEQVAEVAPAVPAAELAVVAAGQRWGLSEHEAWAEVDPRWSRTALALRMARAAGVPPSSLLLSGAEDLRAARLAAVDVAAARLGVRLVVPLGVAFLPAFVLTTIVPVVLALARQVLAS